MESEAERWAAIVSKDAATDGAFVYCVKSTKIYCRPTCHARLPRRANILTYDKAHEAVQAGYRPCKRCRPELASYAPQDDKIQRACDIICRYSLGPDNPRLELLAQETGLTKYHFHRLFKRKTGLTPKQFAEALRASDSTPVASLPLLDDDDSTPSLASDQSSPVSGNGTCLPSTDGPNLIWPASNTSPNFMDDTSFDPCAIIDKT